MINLSAREAEVMELFVELSSLKAVAGRLNLSPNTVSTHIVRVKRKMINAGLLTYEPGRTGTTKALVCYLTKIRSISEQHYKGL